MTGISDFMMSSGLKVPIPEIPMPDLAVPIAAPAELRMIAAAHLLIITFLKKKIVNIIEFFFPYVFDIVYRRRNCKMKDINLPSKSKKWSKYW